ncbi:MAG: hypothetical protein RIF41_28440, partial [Polyangiaceae bacterium]
MRLPRRDLGGGRGPRANRTHNCGLTAPPGEVDGLRLALRALLDRTWDRAACAAAMAKHTLTRTGERYVEVCAEAAS